MTSYRRIEEAFHCKLKGPVVVDKKTLVELQNFQTVCLFKAEQMFMNRFSFASFLVAEKVKFWLIPLSLVSRFVSDPFASPP